MGEATHSGTPEPLVWARTQTVVREGGRWPIAILQRDHLERGA